MRKIIRFFKTILYDIIRFFAMLHFLILIPPKYLYEDGADKSRKLKNGGLIIANHQSWLDPVYMSTIFYKRRIGFIAASDIGNRGFVKFILKITNALKINRLEVDYQGLKAIVSTLKTKQPLLIFPNGKIAETEEFNYKPGMVMMAYLANVEIIPVYIEKYRIFRRTIVKIGAPIKINDGSKLTNKFLESKTNEISKQMKALKGREK